MKGAIPKAEFVHEMTGVLTLMCGIFTRLRPLAMLTILEKNFEDVFSDKLHCVRSGHSAILLYC